jgi:hypothetical protein
MTVAACRRQAVTLAVNTDWPSNNIKPVPYRFHNPNKQTRNALVSYE